MKRKVNKIGPSTLMVSLPSKWAKLQGIKAGDEIDLTEEESRVIISKEIVPRKLEINIDLSDSGVMLNRIIAAIYKSGFDYARITYNTPQELEVIQNTVYRACHVYEIMNVKENVVEIKAISQLDQNQFKQVLRKMAQAFITIAKEAYESIKAEDYKNLENLPLKDQTVDRHTDFCRRVINRGGETGYKLTAPLYVIVEETEIAADIFKTIVKDIIKNKSSLSPELLQLFQNITTLIERLYDLLFDFKIEKVKSFGILEVKIRKEVEKLCSTGSKNILVLAYLINLFETVFEMKSAVLTMHLAEISTTS